MIFPALPLDWKTIWEEEEHDEQTNRYVGRDLCRLIYLLAHHEYDLTDDSFQEGLGK